MDESVVSTINASSTDPSTIPYSDDGHKVQDDGQDDGHKVPGDTFQNGVANGDENGVENPVEGVAEGIANEEAHPQETVQEAEVQEQVQAKVQAEVQAKVQAKVQAEVQAEVPPKLQPELQPEVQAALLAETAPHGGVLTCTAPSGPAVCENEHPTPPPNEANDGNVDVVGSPNDHDIPFSAEDRATTIKKFGELLLREQLKEVIPEDEELAKLEAKIEGTLEKLIEGEDFLEIIRQEAEQEFGAELLKIFGPMVDLGSTPSVESDASKVTKLDPVGKTCTIVSWNNGIGPLKALAGVAGKVVAERSVPNGVGFFDVEIPKDVKIPEVPHDIDKEVKKKVETILEKNKNRLRVHPNDLVIFDGDDIRAGVDCLPHEMDCSEERTTTMKNYGIVRLTTLMTKAKAITLSKVKAELEKAELGKAELEKAELEKAELEEAELEEAELEKAESDKKKYDEKISNLKRGIAKLEEFEPKEMEKSLTEIGAKLQVLKELLAARDGPNSNQEVLQILWKIANQNGLVSIFKQKTFAFLLKFIN